MPTMNYSGLNHTEFLIEKIILLVSLDNNQIIKTVPLGVRFQFWVALNVNCSSGRVRVTSLRMENQTEFINEVQISAANYTGILQQMSDKCFVFFDAVCSTYPIPSDKDVHWIPSRVVYSNGSQASIASSTQILCHKRGTLQRRLQTGVCETLPLDVVVLEVYQNDVMYGSSADLLSILCARI